MCLAQKGSLLRLLLSILPRRCPLALPQPWRGLLHTLRIGRVQMEKIFGLCHEPRPSCPFAALPRPSPSLSPQEGTGLVDELRFILLLLLPLRQLGHKSSSQSRQLRDAGPTRRGRKALINVFSIRAYFRDVHGVCSFVFVGGIRVISIISCVSLHNQHR